MSTSATSIRRSEYAYDTCAEDLDLRAALRNVRVLPAPTQVEDLLSRLDDETVATTSGDLAEIILDARYPDLAHELVSSWAPPRRSREEFFEPTTRAANANERESGFLIPRLVDRIFKTVVFGAGLIIGWNALVRTDNPILPPDPLPVLPQALPGPDLIADWTSYPGVAVTVQDSASDAHVPMGSALPEEATLTISAPLEAPVHEGIVPPTLSEIEGATTAQGLNETAILGERMASSHVLDVDQATVDVPDVESLASDPIGLHAVLDTESRADPGEPSHAREAHGNMVTASGEEIGPSDLEPNPGALASPSETSLAEPLGPLSQPGGATFADAASTGPEVSAEGPAVSLTGTLPATTPERLRPGRTVKPQPLRPVARARLPFIGVWATSREACSSEMQREGHLLAHISARQGRAGDTVCAFRNIKVVGATWRIAASCSDGETKWKSQVRLSVAQGRLSWASHKGSTSYVRCPRVATPSRAET
jgi:hypothetical protein